METESEPVKAEETKAEETKAEGSAEAPAEPMDSNGTGTTNGDAGAEETAKWSEDGRFKALLGRGLGAALAGRLTEAMASNVLTAEDVDDRVVEMMRGMAEEQAVFVCAQLAASSLVGVQNKASFLMALMKNFKDRVRTQGLEAAMAAPLIAGPESERVEAMLEKSGYSLEVTMGQRKYGGPPPAGPAVLPSGPGHECYVGHIPKELFEDSLIPLFEECGTIWDMRLMMDPVTGTNRGYAFVTFVENGAAKKCAQKYTGYEIRPGRKLKVNVSVANTRLFLGNIPKSKSKEEILDELKNHSEGVRDVIVYTNPDAGEGRRNRGFCFADFEDHKAASDARRKLSAGKTRPFNCDLVVDWAEAQDEPDDTVMERVKVLYVRNLKEAVSEEELRELFGAYGHLERVKKLRDYAFVHFAQRPDALKAMEEKNGALMHGLPIDVTLAKPQMDKAKRERMKQERERRQMFQFQRGGGPGRGRGRGMPPMGPMGMGMGGPMGPYDGYGGGYGGGGWGAGFGGGGGWGGGAMGGGGRGRGRGRGAYVGSIGSVARQMQMEGAGYGGGWGGGWGGDEWGAGGGGGGWGDGWSGGGGAEEYGWGGDWSGGGGGGAWGADGGFGGPSGYGKPPSRGFGSFSTRARGRGGGPMGGAFKRKNDEMGAEGGFPKRPAPESFSYGASAQPDWSADVDPGF